MFGLGGRTKLKPRRGMGEERRALALACRLLLPILCLLFVSCVSLAFADDAPPTEAVVSAALRDGALLQLDKEPVADEIPTPPTDPQAAENLPHRDLNRDQASNLLEAVFGEHLEDQAKAPGDEVEVERFYSNHAAVVASPAGDESQKRALLTSTLPLRTEDQFGEQAPIDLNLESSQGELSPSNPLVEVEIPNELGEGITLPELNLGIDLLGAPVDRSPSTVSETSAFYPNVATDTDLTIVPTVTGVETFTQVRSPEAPKTQTYGLSVPPGAQMVESNGAIEIVQGERKLAIIPPPSAIDADGNPVKATMAASGSNVSVSIAPMPTAAYPILVDPYVEAWHWSHLQGEYDAWLVSNAGANFFTSTMGKWGGEYGLNIKSLWGAATPGYGSVWVYQVPRFHIDMNTIHVPPTSYIDRMSLSGIYYWFEDPAPFALDPNAFFGLYAENFGWLTLYSRNGPGGMIQNGSLTGTNPTHATNTKEALLGMQNFSEYQTRPRHLWVPQAEMEITDNDWPKFGWGNGPGKWVDQVATAPIAFEATDTGLGMYSLLVKTPKLGGGPPIQWEKNVGCFGNVEVPCPRSWAGEFWDYNPGMMPQGENVVELIGKDPIWHFSDQVGAQKLVKVKVDHSDPVVAPLSGSVAEQSSLGTLLPQYTLTVAASDGNESNPQSGVTRTVVKVDGVIASDLTPGCPSKNCAVSRSWIYEAKKYATGKHVIEVVAEDGVQRKATRSIVVESVNDTSFPQLATTSGLYTAPNGWVGQHVYGYGAEATDDGGYGVTELTLTIDGNVVQSVKQPCPTGGCALKFPSASAIDLDEYVGGSHAAELIAKDAAGNRSVKSWTMNVNPSGHIPAGEATDTLEAVEASGPKRQDSGSAPGFVGESNPEGDIGVGGTESVEQGTEGELETNGSPANLTISEDPSEGFTIEVSGVNDKAESVATSELEIVPTEISGTASPVEVANESAAIVANSGTGVDSVVRPIFNGAMTFENIRDNSAPESYSWQVRLGEDEFLEQIDSQNVAVMWPNGIQTMLIRAESAHDRNGFPVPTTISVSEGNVITLTVHYHQVNPVLPVVAGVGWEGGIEFHEAEFYEPPRPEAEEEGGWIGNFVVGSPEPAPDEAQASGGSPHRGYFGFDYCAEFGICEAWKVHVRGFFGFNTTEAWFRTDRQPKCELSSAVTYSLDLEQCEWVGSNHQKFNPGSPYGIENFHITAAIAFDAVKDMILFDKHSHKHAMFRAWGNGYSGAWPTTEICNPLRLPVEDKCI